MGYVLQMRLCSPWPCLSLPLGCDVQRPGSPVLLSYDRFCLPCPSQALSLLLVKTMGVNGVVAEDDGMAAAWAIQLLSLFPVSLSLPGPLGRGLAVPWICKCLATAVLASLRPALPFKELILYYSAVPLVYSSQFIIHVKYNSIYMLKMSVI